MFKKLADWITEKISAVALHLDATNRDRFNRWSKFLGRKMFLCLIGDIILTCSYLAVLGVIAYKSGCDRAAQSFENTFTMFGTLFSGILGGGLGANVMEHKENTKVAIANAKATVDPNPKPEGQ